MAKPGTLFKKGWAMRFGLDPDAGADALAYWIEQSSSDEWSFDDLERLIGVFLDDGRELRDFPPALARWATEVAGRRRTRPNRPGPKTDPKRDVAITILVDYLVGEGHSQREAMRLLGDGLSLSPKTIESCRRRTFAL